MDRLESSSPRPLVVLVDPVDGVPSLLRGFEAGPWQGVPGTVAMSFLEDYGEALGLRPEGSSWEPVATRGVGDHWLVRLRQTYLGVPVLGAQVVLKVDPRGLVTMVAGKPKMLRGHLPPLNISAEQASSIAVGSIYGEPVAEPEPELLLSTDPWTISLIYQAMIYTRNPVRAWRVRVDASTGRVLDFTDTRNLARGQAYEHNPVNSQLVDVELEGLPLDAAELIGDDITVQSVVFDAFGNQDYQHLAQADEQWDFYYEPDDTDQICTDPFVEVNTYYHVASIHDYFQQVHGHEYTGHYDILTNYQESPEEPYDNAYSAAGYNGGYIIALGQGIVDTGYDSDVIHHEFGHSIIDDLTDVTSALSYPLGFDEYGFNVSPHAMNEGMADYWSSTFNGDSHSAEYFGSAFGLSCLRELDNDYTCPEDIYGEPHWDGQIIGGTTWEIHELIGAQAADELFYAALGLMAPAPSFKDMAEAVREAADDMSDAGSLTLEQLDGIDQVLERRGWDRCGRWIEMGDGQPEQGTWLGADLVSDYLGASVCDLGRAFGILFPLPFQYSFTTPPASEGAPESLEIHLELTPYGGGSFADEDLQFSIYIRRGQPVTFSVANLNQWLSYDYAYNDGVQDFDLAFDFDDEPDPLLIPAGDEQLPLEPGTTYYLDVAGMNCVTTEFSLTANLLLSEPEGDAAEASSGGCGCTTISSGASHRGAAVVMVLLLGPALRGRRKSSRRAPCGAPPLTTTTRAIQ